MSVLIIVFYFYHGIPGIFNSSALTGGNQAEQLLLTECKVKQQLENVFNFTVRRSCCSAWFPCESSGIKYSRNSVIKIKHNYQHSHLPAIQSEGNIPDIDIWGLHLQDSVKRGFIYQYYVIQY